MMITRTTPALPTPSDEQRETIAALPRDVETHDAMMAHCDFMTSIEIGGAASDAPLEFPLTIAAWNLERCLFPKASADKIAATGAALVLLSEMDNGMARTAQANTTADVAGHLGMAYAYGVEFLELGLGSDTELRFCRDNRNTLGFHGNALMARGGLRQPFMLRLTGKRRWFTEATDQPRLGERMAIGAVLETTQGQIIAVSTHLESNATVVERHAQIAGLIDALDAAFPSLPIVIGGDLNSGNHIAGDWRDETFFNLAHAHGFSIHGGPPEQPTTRPSLITLWPERAMKLDWFLTRGVRTGQSWIEPSLDADGRPLSDHDMIVLDITGL